MENEIKKQQRQWVESHQCDMVKWQQEMLNKFQMQIKNIKDPNHFIWKNVSQDAKNKRIKEIENEIKIVMGEK